MPFTVATWNINSVRLRIGLVTEFLQRFQPDILCLQETKCPDDQFPRTAFAKIGYGNIAVKGQKGYHGVATISRHPFRDQHSRDMCAMGDARHLVTTFGSGRDRFQLHNFYVPAGGDEPDPAINPKFAHKLAFIEEMTGWLTGPETAGAAMLVGDLNIAPLETDVWSHKQLLNVVSHTPVETEGMERMRVSGGWVDAVREFIPPEEKLYSWWSYRARDWESSNRGRRLDHVWVTPKLRPRMQGIEVIREARGWERPSDHVPIIARMSD